MKQIPLTQGKVAWVSDQDYPLVRQLNWAAWRNAAGNWYARCYRNKRVVLMHRMIAGETPFRMDHHNRNGLDNRRCNLRAATSSQNAANSKRRSDNTSGFKGVPWFKCDQKWYAHISLNGRMKFLGSFVNKILAHTAYIAAAKEFFGVYARP